MIDRFVTPIYILDATGVQRITRLTAATPSAKIIIRTAVQKGQHVVNPNGSYIEPPIGGTR